MRVIHHTACIAAMIRQRCRVLQSMRSDLFSCSTDTFCSSHAPCCDRYSACPLCTVSSRCECTPAPTKHAPDGHRLQAALFTRATSPMGEQATATTKLEQGTQTALRHQASPHTTITQTCTPRCSASHPRCTRATQLASSNASPLSSPLSTRSPSPASTSTHVHKPHTTLTQATTLPQWHQHLEAAAAARSQQRPHATPCLGGHAAHRSHQTRPPRGGATSHRHHPTA